MTNLNDESANITEGHLKNAVRKASWRLIPLLFVCYVIAYIDRVNVSLAALTMKADVPGFTEAVIGIGAGIFFLGYFILEIPGTILVEKWRARKWICRIMVTWGIIAACFAFVHFRIPVLTDCAIYVTHGLFRIFAILITPLTWLPGDISNWASGNMASLRSEMNPDVAQFYSLRFLLGLAEAGFFPGVIVYMTHWFPIRARSRALSWFLIGTPAAQILSMKTSYLILKIGTDETVNGIVEHHPALFGFHGWQLLFIFWGLPAVILGVVVLFFLHDRPRHAPWLTAEEKTALEETLAAEKAKMRKHHHMGFLEAMYHPKVLLLALAYCLIVTGNYGVDIFLPSILKEWYSLSLNNTTWLAMLPACAALVAILLVGWNSDRTHERHWHAAIPGLIGGIALIAVPHTHGNLIMTMVCFMAAAAGLKAYLPPFWCLPSLFLTEVAAAGSIGLINSVGNLGGYFGPSVVGKVKDVTHSFNGGIYFLGGCMVLYSVIIALLRLGHKPSSDAVPAAHRDFEAVIPESSQPT